MTDKKHIRQLIYLLLFFSIVTVVAFVVLDSQVPFVASTEPVIEVDLDKLKVF